MSTRRARIKAVASLPVRRKNTENKDSVKHKPTTPKQQLKDTFEYETEVQLNENEHFIESSKPIIIESKSEAQSEISPRTSFKPSGNTPKLLDRIQSTPKAKKVASPHLINLFTNRIQSPIKIAAPSPLISIEKSKPYPTILNKFETHNKDNSIKVSQEIAPLNLTSETSSSFTHIAGNKDTSEILDGISKIPDYNPPSIPECGTEEAVLDGITPLQSSSVPKPLDLLKNEIISENAEVLFDPIVPLPSPSKVRPKLRPVPRLAFRRNSVQGSASESEDESRRALLSSGVTTPQRQRHDSHTSHNTQSTFPNRETNRVRNDSVCSTISQATTQPAVPAAATLSKEKHGSKCRRAETGPRSRVSALRRRQRGRELARETLTMYDLIFYNPTTNPIVRDEEDTAIVKEDEEIKKDNSEATVEPEETADEPPEADEATPVPQIKLGPNGEIILDEKSLVIEQTEGPRKLSSSDVHENEWANGGRGKYTRSRRTAEWTDAETVRFYRALAAVGTDFTLMRSLFPDRTRRDLKVKFKKEERINGAQVDKALVSQIAWDVSTLEEEFAIERRLAVENAERERLAYIEMKNAEKLRQRNAKLAGLRCSRAAKAIEVDVGGINNIPDGHSADSIIKRTLEANAKRKAARLSHTINEVTPLVTNLQLNENPDTSPYATLKLIKKHKPPSPKFSPKLAPKATITPKSNVPDIPSDIEAGSLVVLTVNDPNNPAKKILQTYISHGAGRLTPVSLQTSLLNSVVSYMKKGTPKSTTNSSPQFTSPSSIASQESRSSVIQVNPSPAKRSRHDSYNITEL